MPGWETLSIGVAPEAPASRTATRGWSGLLDDLQDRHHAGVLVVEHVAVEDGLAGEVGEVDADDDLSVAGDDRGVHPAAERLRHAVDAYHLEVVDVDVDGVFFAAGVADDPFLHGVQLGPDVYPVRVELLAVDVELGPCCEIGRASCRE